MQMTDDEIVKTIAEKIMDWPPKELIWTTSGRMLLERKVQDGTPVFSTTGSGLSWVSGGEHSGFMYEGRLFDPLNNVLDALHVLDVLAKTHHWALISVSDPGVPEEEKRVRCDLGLFGTDRTIMMRGRSIERAICLAALETLG